MMDEQRTSQFLDLLAYQQLSSSPTGASGNLIKAKHIACKGSRAIEVNASTEDTPTIITHRDGDVITAIEFVCPCGQSTVVSLEYE